MNSPLPIGVSIVVYHNPSDEIRQLVDLLLQENLARVYVIDNANCATDLQTALASDPRVCYMAGHGNVGYGRGHNLAIRESVDRHKYHLVCNPDIGFSPGTIACLYQLLESRPDVGLCMPKVVGHDGHTHYLCKQLPAPFDLFSRRFLPRAWTEARMRTYEMRDRSYDREMNPPTMSGCFMFFRGSVLARLKGFDERFFMYMEDTDLSRRAGELAVNLYYPAVVVTHGYAAGSYKRLRLLGYHLVSAVKYFNKWGWSPLA